MPGTVLPILVTDDEEALRHLLRLLFEREGYEVVVAADGLEALEVLERRPDIRIVFTDIRMPRLDGTALLERLRGRGLFVVMMSAFGSTETAVEALSKGAWDYVAKPFRPAEVVRCLTRIREHIALETENARLKAARLGSPADRFLGGSRQADEIRELVGKVAPSDSTVLVTGESGTGKELVALAIHEGSPRTDGPFVAINCGAIPSTLLESQLFGHDKGAFTGADRARGGVFEEADGGTLFLDEIGDMPQALQVGLLRVLEDHTVRRSGIRSRAIGRRARRRGDGEGPREGGGRGDLPRRSLLPPARRAVARAAAPRAGRRSPRDRAPPARRDRRAAGDGRDRDSVPKRSTRWRRTTGRGTCASSATRSSTR